MLRSTCTWKGAGAQGPFPHYKHPKLPQHNISTHPALWAAPRAKFNNRWSKSLLLPEGIQPPHEQQPPDGRSVIHSPGSALTFAPGPGFWALPLALLGWCRQHLEGPAPAGTIHKLDPIHKLQLVRGSCCPSCHPFPNKVLWGRPLGLPPS